MAGKTMVACAPARTWTQVGAQYSEPYRAVVEREIDGLTWRSEREAAMMPALGINACIEQLGLPKVSAYATDGYLRIPPAGEFDEGAHYSIYGIEANYGNGRARVYVLDTGTGLLPLASDFWPKEAGG